MKPGFWNSPDYLRGYEDALIVINQTRLRDNIAQLKYFHEQTTDESLKPGIEAVIMMFEDALAFTQDIAGFDVH